MKTKKFLFILTFQILISLFTVASGMDISLDAKDSDIKDLLSGLAKSNGINLILGDSISGKITISLNNVDPMKAIELILRANGYTFEKIDNSIIAAKPEELKNILPKSSKVIKLQYVSASELKQALNSMASSYNVQIEADPRTNSIIITGTETGVQKIEQALKQLDIQLPEKSKEPLITKTYKLRNSRATMIQSALSHICSPEGKISADDKTNSLVIVDNAKIFEQLENIITELDSNIIPTDKEKELAKASELHTRIFNLNYIDSNSIKDIIQDMLSQNGKIQTFVRQKESIIPIQSKEASGGSSGSSSSGKEQTDVRGSTSNKATAEQKWSDTLIVTDITSVLDSVEELINKLDTKARQVRIEAKILEVNSSGAEELGIDWQGTHAPSGSTFKGIFPVNRSGSAESIVANIGTLTTQNFENIMLTLKALETQGKAKLISNPSITTLDNELAQMIVADRIPIPKTMETQLIATTSYEFINVGILLTVIPHIAEDGYIIMDAMPEVDSIKDWTSGKDPQPIVSSRLAHSRVRIKDGETFVIGGLMRNEENNSSSHVPLLGKIPILGNLFGAKRHENSKTELMVFITPKICNDN